MSSSFSQNRLNYKVMYDLEQYKIKDKITSWDLKAAAEKFLQAKTLPTLAKVLGVKLEHLKHLAQHRKYIQFYVPKPNGKRRLIETPNKELKRVLQKLNYFFQATYHSRKPDCAYGCITATADEKITRNIYTNAMQHIGKKWILNLDIKDFFHSISFIMVRKIFRTAPYNFNENTVKLLADLVTHQERLPIGTPTSPALSNLVVLELDQQIMQLSKEKKWKYTRYIDDMSFSSHKKFTKKQIQKIIAIIEAFGFQLNKNKFQLCKISEQPMVTGLILTPTKPDVSKLYIKNIKEDILIYHWLTSSRIQNRNIFPTDVIKKLRDSIFGQINFVKTIRGEGHRSYLKLMQEFRPGMFH